MNPRLSRRSAPSFGSAARGLSLIEVLVAVLVLGLGLLGLAMLQTTNLRLVQSSNQRTIATNLASDLLDDIRSNRLLAAQYGGTYSAGSVAAGATCARTGANLTPSDRKKDFTCRMKNALGDSSQAVVTVVDRTVTIQITWDDAKRWNALAANSKFEMESAL